MSVTIEVINSRTGLSLGNKITVASTFWQRFVGLLGRSGLKSEQGLLIQRCNQVHMFFMRFEIAAIFISPNQTILSIEPRLKRWTCSKLVSGATSVLELPLGVLEEANCQVGDVLQLVYR